MSATILKCPKCHENSKSDVLDSRSPMTGDYIRRRRKCGLCGHKFSTREVVLGDDPKDDPQSLKALDVLNLRTIAIDILRRTDATTSCTLSGNNSPRS